MTKGAKGAKGATHTVGALGPKRWRPCPLTLALLKMIRGSGGRGSGPNPHLNGSNSTEQDGS